MTLEIPLHSRKYPGMVAIVDDEDAELVSAYRWYAIRPNHPNSTFYATTILRDVETKKRVRLYMHRLILPGTHRETDHIDGNGLRNVRSNLRPATSSQNRANGRLLARSTSGFKGVYFRKQQTNRPWQARIHFWKDGRQRHVHLGSFETPELAAAAYDKAALERYGEFAKTNQSLGLLSDDAT